MIRQFQNVEEVVWIWPRQMPGAVGVRDKKKLHGTHLRVRTREILFGQRVTPAPGSSLHHPHGTGRVGLLSCWRSFPLGRIACSAIPLHIMRERAAAEADGFAIGTRQSVNK